MATEKKHVFDADERGVAGEFVDIDGERYYAIHNVDRMSPFFISVVSSSDHWLFASSNGGLTAGRVSPDTALFPYVSVDKIHDSVTHTGSVTLVQVKRDGSTSFWEPFNQSHDHRYRVTRNIYKSQLGDKLRFEEINHDLHIAFHYTWQTSDPHGFVRSCALTNLGNMPVDVEILDGLRNILPAGTPRFAQTNTSNLVDAYKWTELDTQTGLAFFTLYSGITDRAEPCESLRANTVYSLGLDNPTILLSTGQLDDFRFGRPLQQETRTRGTRGSFLAHAALTLAPRQPSAWSTVANIELDQAEVVALRGQLRDRDAISQAIVAAIADGSDRLARLMANADALQVSAEEHVSVHHYANVLFNVLRGGIFDDDYRVYTRDFRRTLRCFDKSLAQRHSAWLDDLPDSLDFNDLLQRTNALGDSQLRRLCQEYLPIRFGRRHGDPSRPWNQFAIELRDDDGQRILSYQGNWRDVFQNWEALGFSYPEFVENMIAKFVNATTMDGYNPYRITDQGIDWEVEEPDDPWSYIGYWGDHQIIYLQKLLELSQRFHPQRLAELMHEPVFAYANVPYRVRLFDDLLKDPKSTVDYDEALAEKIEKRVAERGADGKLIIDADGNVHLATLLEKLLVPLLAKLGNLVVDGGIWLNTQRPEWNDANNALVGQGLSMVTLYYMRRYVTFLKHLLADEADEFELSIEVSDWLTETAAAMSKVHTQLSTGPVDDAQRFGALDLLGRAASRYRERVYAQEGFSGKVAQSTDVVRSLLDDALAAIDHSIANNRRDDGLYHAYNIADFDEKSVGVDNLYPMLEGQVAALSAGAIPAREAIGIIDALFDSPVYRADQNTFMLYPDRELPGFLARNRVPEARAMQIALVKTMLDTGDGRLVIRDEEGHLRFNADLTSGGQLDQRLDELEESFGRAVEAARRPLKDLYESVFDHKSFTGRSGTMFGFEGLGCIYWHMVAKLQLALLENYFAALEGGEDATLVHGLGKQYYRVRAGLGFNKTPAEFGAFPTDPYSHTPGHAGASQPGMTGQVKEELLSRFGELGVRVSGGAVTFRPSLLKRQEFLAEARSFRYLDAGDRWQRLELAENSLAFSWCQVPVVYQLGKDNAASICISLADGSEHEQQGTSLPVSLSNDVFKRNANVRRIIVTLGPEQLFQT